jgi:transketolase
MAQYSNPNIKFMGSHAGSSIGEDGPSQMGLEDIAMFRAMLDSVVLYPCDALSAEKLVEAAAEHEGLVYLRMTRPKSPVIYDADEGFPIGGSKTVRSSDNDQATVVSAGYTLHEALAAHEALARDGIAVRVIDLYSIKPLDRPTLQKAVDETGALVVVEDHYPEGGIGEAVGPALQGREFRMKHLAVRKKPQSAPGDTLLADEGLDAAGIANAVRELLS